MSRVDFFIVGAPRCGTTALARYLEEHPHVYFSQQKEPQFFCSDFPKLRKSDTLEAYHRDNFKNFQDHSKTYGEGSTFYLYSKEAIKNIKTYNKNAKIIIMLRDPVAVVHSLYEFRRYGASEVNIGFEKVWALNDSRKQGQDLPPQWPYDPDLLFYNEIAAFGTQLRRVYQYFENASVKVIFFDNFIKNTKEVYLEVLSFLNLQDDSRNTFNKINSAKWNRYEVPRQIARKLFYDEAQWIKRILGIEAYEILLMKMGLIKEGKRHQMSRELKRIIRCSYKLEILKIQELVDRDLSNWLTE